LGRVLFILPRDAMRGHVCRRAIPEFQQSCLFERSSALHGFPGFDGIDAFFSKLTAFQSAIAPVTPVLPPCGTMAVRVEAHISTTRDICAVVWGKTISGERPLQLSRQELIYGAITPGSMIMQSSPTTSRMGTKTLLTNASEFRIIHPRVRMS
jgi:hypothetical protein